MRSIKTSGALIALALLGCGGGGGGHQSSSTTVGTLAVSPSTVAVNVGISTTLTTVAQNAAGSTIATSDYAVTWTTSSAGIATVSSAGVVTGVAAGTVTITATESTAGKTATSTITVTPNTGGATVTVG